MAILPGNRKEYEFHLRSNSSRCHKKTAGYTTDLMFHLSHILRRPANHIFHMWVSSLDLPRSWYDFKLDVLNNTRLIAGNGTYTFTLPDGNYNAWEVAEQMTNDAAFPFSLSYDDNTFKFTITNTHASLTITVNFTNANSQELAKILGFDPDVEVALIAGASSTGTNVCNFNPIHSLFVHSDLAVDNVFTSDDYGRQGIVNKIPLGNTVPGSTINYVGTHEKGFKAELNSNEISAFSFCIKDQAGRLLDTNNIDFEISFIIEEIEYMGMREGVHFLHGPGKLIQENNEHYHNNELAGLKRQHREMTIGAEVLREAATGSKLEKMEVEPAPEPITVISPEEVERIEEQERDIDSAILIAASLDL